MSIVPTSFSSRPYLVRQLGDMRDQLDKLQQEMATGKRASTNAGLGSQRVLSLAYRQQASETQSYLQTIALANTRLQVISSTLQRIGSLGTEAKGALDPNIFAMQTNGISTGQQSATNYLQELTALLNTDVAGRSIFGGKATDTTPIETIDKIMNGDNGKAGLRQVIAERRAADLGADGFGRLVVDPVASDTVSFSEDAAGSPFGFKVQSISSNLNGANVSGPTGSPPGMSIALTAQPQIGQTVSITLGLPDGSTTTVTLKAAQSAGPGAFTLGSSLTETADNLRTALMNSLDTAGKTALSAASALQASKEFFASGGNPALRVNGSPPETATSLRDATDTDTVAWYKGDNSAGDPREDALAKVDKTITVAYGMRANESGFASMFANLAALAAADFSAGDDTASGQSSEMIRRIRVNLADGTGLVNATTTEMAGRQVMLDQAKDRLTIAKSTLADLTDQVEGVDITETSANLLSLQTRIQASYEATAIVFKLNLADYL